MRDVALWLAVGAGCTAFIYELCAFEALLRHVAGKDTPMVTLEEAIKPYQFEVAVVVPCDANVREWHTDKARAIEVARHWACHRWPQVTITAYGARGPRTDKAFALKHVNWVDGAIVETDWRTWLSAGKFIGGTD